MLVRRLTLTTFLLFLQVSAQGALIYDNGPLIPGDTSLSIRGGRTADDFVLAGAAVIDTIRFYLPSGRAPDLGGSASYAIYQDSAGFLGTTLTTGSNTPLITELTTPPAASGVYQVDLTLTSPILLAPGSYWLEVHKGPSLTYVSGFPVYWLTLADVAGNAKMDGTPALPSTDKGYSMAFQLYGTEVAIPEPFSHCLVLSGLGALMLKVRLSRITTVLPDASRGSEQYQS